MTQDREGEVVVGTFEPEKTRGRFSKGGNHHEAFNEALEDALNHKIPKHWPKEFEAEIRFTAAITHTNPGEIQQYRVEIIR